MLSGQSWGEYDRVSPEWFDVVSSEGHPSSMLTSSPTATRVEENSAANLWIVRLTSDSIAGIEHVTDVSGFLDTETARFDVYRGLGLPGLVLAGTTHDVATAKAALQANPRVASFELNTAIRGQASQLIPNDSELGRLTGLDNVGQSGGTNDADIDALEAWHVVEADIGSVGSREVVVGVVDSGIDMAHPDLYLNIWINQGEIPPALFDPANPHDSSRIQDTDDDGLITFVDLNNPVNSSFVADQVGDGNAFIDAYDLLADPRWVDGVNNDLNGPFVDDLFGWDFQSGGVGDKNAHDEHGHGTHVAGTIGAVGNNGIGTSGVNWAVSLMPLRFLDANRAGTLANAIQALNYTTMMRQDFGVNMPVTNNSWGYRGAETGELRAALEANAAADMLVVAAAGNGDALGNGIDNDADPRFAFYPASDTLDQIISVAATDGSDRLARFSNFGATTVDLGAPGVAILSTDPKGISGPYFSRSGTSMAAPYVTGVAALVWAMNPGASAAEVKAAILDPQSLDPLTDLAGKTLTGGRLNAFGAVSIDTIAPRAKIVAMPDVNGPGQAHVDITIYYGDNRQVSQSSINGDELQVVDTFDGTQLSDIQLINGPTVVPADAGDDFDEWIAATYRVSAPGGMFEDGDFQVSLQASSVFDTQVNAAKSTVLGTFNADTSVGLLRAKSLNDDMSADSLRAAVQAANASPVENTIRLTAGTYVLSLLGAGEDAAAAGDLDLTGTLIIRGAGADKTIIDAGQIDRVFHVLPGASVELRDLTVIGGVAANGGGILVAAGGSLTIRRAMVSGNQAVAGGGLFNSGNLTISQSTLHHNSATDGGGLDNHGAASLSNTTISTNTASATGGGIRNAAGTLNLTNVTIAENSAAVAGGGVYNPGAVLEAEPNDATSLAQPLDGEIWTTGFDSAISQATSFPHVSTIGTGDDTLDYYRFHVANAGDRAIFDVDFPNGYDKGFIPSMRLYDASQVQVAEWDPSQYVGEPLITETDQVKVFVPASGSLGLLWTGGFEPFNDSTWQLTPVGGPNGVGFDSAPDFLPFIGANVGAQMTANNTSSVYLRIPFDIVDPSAFASLALDVRYDDGFIAYINGQIVASRNSPATASWNSTATVLHDDLAAVVFERIVIPSESLVAGTNILAVHGLNVSASSSDMLIQARLSSSTTPVPTVEVLVPPGAAWRYLDNGSNQGTAWKEPSFDDSLWPAGNGQLGYGDGDEATVVGFGADPNNRYATTYFRKTFNVADVTAIEGLELRILRDDGATVYLNGHEVVRTNLAANAAFDVFAPFATGAAESQFLPFVVDSSLLIDGINVLAVEVHQAAATSTDLSFDLELRSIDVEGRDLNAFDRVWAYTFNQPGDYILAIGMFDVPFAGPLRPGAEYRLNVSVENHVETAAAVATAINTIIANNNSALGPDFRGDIVSLGHNLTDDPSGSNGWINADLTDVDPLLGPLQINGDGTTFPLLTHGLATGSPAIDAGYIPQASGTFISTDAPKPILDLVTLSSNLSVAGMGAVITDVNVTLDLTHSYVGDLEVHLISPQGTRVLLFASVGGEGDSFSDTTFDDEAATHIAAGVAPFAGAFRPTQLLARFAGENPNGDWMLSVKDREYDDEGILNSWSLTLTTDVFNAPYFAADQLGVSRPQDADGAEIAVLDIGALEKYFGSIEGTYYHDLNENGVFDFGEPGMPGVTLYLDESGNGDFDSAETSTVTNAEGKYFFRNVPPGGHRVVDVPSTGWAPSETDFGGAIQNVSIGFVDTYASESQSVSFSANGRYIVFDSTASTLVPNDTNNASDVFIFDQFNNTLERLSVTFAGEQGNGSSLNPSISADGRFVAFESNASNLVPSDTNIVDIFVFDRQQRTIDRVSVASNGLPGNDSSTSASLSADGRYVAFESRATNLVPNDHNGDISPSNGIDVFVFDRSSRVTERISVGNNGSEGDSSSKDPSISSDGRWVAFESSASTLVPNDTNNSTDIFVFDRLVHSVERASVGMAGADANSFSITPSLSSDGRYVVFQSGASNLIPDDTNASVDVFVFDRNMQSLDRVSVGHDGLQSNGDSINSFIDTYGASLSADGRYVAFESRATNLVPNDTNGRSDIFVFDRHVRSIERLSMATDGTQGDYDSERPLISPDGRYVAMVSGASNIVPNDTNSGRDNFVIDRQTREVERFGVARSAIQGNRSSSEPAVSGNGRYVAFVSAASNFVPNDTTFSNDIFVFDRQESASRLVSVASDGGVGNGDSRDPSVSANGRYVAFGSWASNLVLGDMNDAEDVFVFDRQAGSVERVSVASNGSEANSYSANPSISADGRYVAYWSNATNLVADDLNGLDDIFVFDRHSKVTERVSLAIGQHDADGYSYNPSISADGRFVAFHSGATNLVQGDTNNTFDVFVFDRQTLTSERVSIDVDGNQGLNGQSRNASISADGRFVAFESRATNLVLNDTNNRYDIFVVDRQSRAIERVSSSGGVQGNGDSATPSISGDGRYVTFKSAASNLVSGDTNNQTDIYVYERQSRSVERVSVNAEGVEGNGVSDSPHISGDGRYIAFGSGSSSLVASDTNSSHDVFVVIVEHGDLTQSIYAPLTAGEMLAGVEFGTRPLSGAIHGQVFHDSNVNGRRDSGELGLTGWRVFLDVNGNAQHDDLEPFRLVNTFGEYVFENVQSLKSYRVAVAAEDLWVQTVPAISKMGVHQLYVGAGGILKEVNFGFSYRGPDAQSVSDITGVVFADTNASGVRDDGEPGLSGKVVYLDSNDNRVLDVGEMSVVTDGGGLYAFVGLPLGRDYLVRILPDTEFSQTQPLNNALPSVDYGAGDFERAQGLVTADFNHDGLPDVVVAHGNYPALLLNDPANPGQFFDPITLPIGQRSAGAFAVVAGKFNQGDDHLDLAVTNFHTNTVSILLGIGNGTFQTGIPYTVGYLPYSLAQGDFDGDGDLDLAVGTLPYGTVRGALAILWNKGQTDGAFNTTPQTVYTSTTFNPYHIETVQLTDDNFDGQLSAADKLDLVVAEFASAVTTGRVVVVLNGGSASYTIPAGNGPAGVDSGDFDGDGDADLAVANFNSDSVSILLNAGNGSLVRLPTDLPAGSGPFAVAVADIDQDGDPDILVANSDEGNLVVLRNVSVGGHIVFGPPEAFGAGTIPNAVSTSVVVADFNNDQTLDVALTYNSNAVTDASGNYLNIEQTGRLKVYLNSVSAGSYEVTLNGIDALPSLDFGLASIYTPPPNDPPTMHDIPNPPAIAEDAGEQTVSLSGIADGDDGSQMLSVAASSSNPGLIPNPVIEYTSSGTTGTLRFMPVANQHGTATITVTVTDRGWDGILGNQDDASFSRQFVVTVDSVNDAPVVMEDVLIVNMNSTNNVFDLLENDFDVDGALAVSYLSAASHGAVVRSENGQVLYTPILGYIGVDQFFYLAFDGFVNVLAYVTVNVVNPTPPANTLRVSTLVPTPSGFEIQFSRAIDVAAVNLYENNLAGLGPVDITLVGAVSGRIAGSVVIEGNQLTFVATAGRLPNEDYTVMLRSAANGIKDAASGDLLDGNGDGTPGDNYSQSFSAIFADRRVVSLPHMARGPGQQVNVPATGTGLPIRLDNGTGVVAVDFMLRWNPTLLDVTAIIPGSGLPGGWTVQSNLVTPGEAIVTLSGTSSLPSGAVQLVRLQSSVPITAAYGASQVLRVEALRLNEGQIAAFVTDALQKVAYLGDTSGNARYLGLDASLLSRVVIGLDEGFGAYSKFDPTIIADATGDGTLSALDTSLVAQKTVFLPVLAIPDLPANLPPIFPSGPDPALSIPTGNTAARGDSLTLPIGVDSGAGLLAALITIRYDTAVFNVSNDDVALGSLVRDLIGNDSWALTPNVDDAAGRIIVLVTSAVPLNSNIGNLLDITYHVVPNAPEGPTTLDLDENSTFLNGGGLILTAHDGSVVIATTGLTGDLNADGGVSLADLMLLRGLLGTDPAVAPLDADFNDDGVIDRRDVAVIAINYGAQIGSPGNSPSASNQASAVRVAASSANQSDIQVTDAALSSQLRAKPRRVARLLRDERREHSRGEDLANDVALAELSQEGTATANKRRIQRGPLFRWNAPAGW